MLLSVLFKGGNKHRRGCCHTY